MHLMFNTANNSSISELREIVRGMNEKIIVNPQPGATLSLTIHGKFAGVMQAAGLLDALTPQTQTAPEAVASRAVGLLVAGAGFEPAAFRL